MHTFNSKLFTSLRNARYTIHMLSCQKLEQMSGVKSHQMIEFITWCDVRTQEITIQWFMATVSPFFRMWSTAWLLLGYLQPCWYVCVCTYVCMCVSMVCLDWSGKRETRVSGQRPYFRVQSKAGRDPLVLEECRGGGLMVSWRWCN